MTIMTVMAMLIVFMMVIQFCEILRLMMRSYAYPQTERTAAGAGDEISTSELGAGAPKVGEVR